MTRDELKTMIADHVTAIETGETEIFCLCEWITRGDKKIYGSVNMDCAVHTKEGLILHFITYSKLKLRDIEPAGRCVDISENSTLDNYLEAEDVDGKSY